MNGAIPNTAVDNREAGGDFCGQGNLTFAQLATPTTTYDPSILNGWAIRPFDWNVGVQVQQQLLPRVSVDVGYFRRIFGNFLATDNLAQNTFDQFRVTAPVDSRLPNGGGAGDFRPLQRRPDRIGKDRTTWCKRPTRSAPRRGIGMAWRSTFRHASATG